MKRIFRCIGEIFDGLWPVIYGYFFGFCTWYMLGKPEEFTNSALGVCVAWAVLCLVLVGIMAERSMRAKLREFEARDSEKATMARIDELLSTCPACGEPANVYSDETLPRYGFVVHAACAQPDEAELWRARMAELDSTAVDHGPRDGEEG